MNTKYSDTPTKVTTTIVGTEWQPCMKTGRFCNGKQSRNVGSCDYQDCICETKIYEEPVKMDTSDEMGIKIIKALGLPEHVRKMEFIFEAHHPVVIRIEYVLETGAKKLEDILTDISEYELRKK